MVATLDDDKKITFSGSVEFRDVCFQYPDAEASILDHISFSAKANETVALLINRSENLHLLI